MGHYWRKSAEYSFATNSQGMFFLFHCTIRKTSFLRNDWSFCKYASLKSYVLHWLFKGKNMHGNLLWKTIFTHVLYILPSHVPLLLPLTPSFHPYALLHCFVYMRALACVLMWHFCPYHTISHQTTLHHTTSHHTTLPFTPHHPSPPPSRWWCSQQVRVNGLTSICAACRVRLKYAVCKTPWSTYVCVMTYVRDVRCISEYVRMCLLTYVHVSFSWSDQDHWANYWYCKCRI